MTPGGDQTLSRRGAADALGRALSRHAVVLLVGPDHVGKSTLARTAFPGATVCIIDLGKDELARQAATADPGAFLRSLRPSTVIDDVHLVPGLLPELDVLADRIRTPGTILAVASRSGLLAVSRATDLRRLPRIRISSMTQGEMRDRVGRFIPAVFAGDPTDWPFEMLSLDDYVDLTLGGGLPDLAAMPDPQLRVDAYTQTIDQILSTVTPQESMALRRILELVLGRGSAQVVLDRDGTELGLRSGELLHGLETLEALGLVRLSPAWTRFRRIDGTVRAYARDGGYLAALLGSVATDRLRRPSPLPVLRTLVANELYTQNEWARHPVTLSYWRSKPSQYDIDFLLEDDTGTIIPVNVSASIAPGVGEFAGIDAFRRRHPRAYQRGLLLYPGDRVRSLSDNRWAVPLSTLWAVADQEVPLDVASLDAELEAAATALRLLVDRVAVPDGMLAEKQATIGSIMRNSLEPRLERIALVLGGLGFGVERIAPVAEPATAGDPDHPVWFGPLRDALGAAMAPVQLTMVSGLDIRPAGTEAGRGTCWVAFVAAVVNGSGDLNWFSGHALSRAAGPPDGPPALVGVAGPLVSPVNRVEESLLDQLSAALAAGLPDALASLAPADDAARGGRAQPL